ncbi:MAG: patatin-like protein [Micromonosporaceae bacterium]
MTARASSESQRPCKLGQELRLATVMTGGVSLAIWMGGLTCEINRLVQAGRNPDEVSDGYLALKRLLDTDVTVDVISGTSAGGINGALLALAVARNADLSFLRSLWLGEASLTELLRSPTERSPRSLMRGDEYFLPALGRAFASIDAPDDTGCKRNDDGYPKLMITTTLLHGETRSVADAYGTVIRDIDHRGLFSFTGQDLARRGVIEPALALAARCTASFPLAFEASFCPVGAPETPTSPSGYVRPDMGPWIDATVSRYTVDGGVLVNKPIGPALQEIFEHEMGGRPVRRILAYIVPDPSVSSDGVREDEANPPPLANVLIESLLEIPLAQSISAELEMIREHNRKVSSQRRTRDEIVWLLSSQGANRSELRDRELPGRYCNYRKLRAEREADTFLQEFTRCLNSLNARRELPERWSPYVEFNSEWRHQLRDRLIEKRTNELVSPLAAGTLPETVAFPKLWELKGKDFPQWVGAFGLVSLERASAVVLDLVRRGLVFAQNENDQNDLRDYANLVHKKLGELRNNLELSHEDVVALGARLDGVIKRPQLKDFAAAVTRPAALQRFTERDADEQAAAIAAQQKAPRAAHGDSTERAAAEHGPFYRWMVRAFECWTACERRYLEHLLPEDIDPPGSVIADLGRCAVEVARLCGKVTQEPQNGLDQRIAPPDERAALAQVASSFEWLLDDWLPGNGTDALGERDKGIRGLAALTLLLELETLEVVLAVQEPVVEQPIQLVQLSADSRCGLDPVRRLASDKLTGVQLNHFGAFYKRAWRANDWLWGRLDGIGWLVHLLLEPSRLLERAVPYRGDPCNPELEPIDWDKARTVRDLGPRGRWAYGELAKIAAPDCLGAAVHDYLESLWKQDEANIVAELLYLDGRGLYGERELPKALPNCSTAVARALQYAALLEELPQVRGAIDLDASDGASAKATGAFCWDYDNLWNPQNAARDPATPVRLLRECEIPRETIAGEAGSDLLTYLATTAGATGLAAITHACANVPGFLKPVVTFTRGILLTLYFLMRAALQNSRTAFASPVLAFAVGFALLAASASPPWNIVGVGLVVAPVVLLATAATRLIASRWGRATRLFVTGLGLTLLLAAPTVAAMLRWRHPSQAPLVRFNLAWAARNPLWVLILSALVVLLIAGWWRIGPVVARPKRLDRALRRMCDDLERRSGLKPGDSSPVSIGLEVDAYLASEIERAAQAGGGRMRRRHDVLSISKVVRSAKTLLADALARQPRPAWCLLTLRPESDHERDLRAAGQGRYAVLEVRVSPATAEAAAKASTGSRPARRCARRLGGIVIGDLSGTGDPLRGNVVEQAVFKLPHSPTGLAVSGSGVSTM